MVYIAQPFRVAILPKISSLNNFATQDRYLQVAGTLNPSSNDITIGISGSSVSQYVINPTPKLVYNLPIPSTNVITACDVAQVSNGQELWCFALLVNNKVNSLNLVNKESAIENSGIIDAAGSNIQKQFKLPIKQKVISIKIFSLSNTILVILEGGLIQTYDMQLNFLYQTDISYENVKLVQYFSSDCGTEEYMFVLCDIKDKTCYKLFYLHPEDQNRPVSELNSVILENFALEESKIIYQFGKLYRLVGSTISIYNLPHFQLSHNIQLPFINKNDPVSLQPISTHRILITNANKIFLLDLLHNALLYERELANITTFQLLATAVIAGQSTSGTNRTIALGISTKPGPNPTSSLDLVTVDVGTGTLKDSLGKGFLVDYPVKNSLLLKPLIPDTVNRTADIKSSNMDYDSILEELSGNISSCKSFDHVFSKRLKLKNEYYTERDRFLNNPLFLAQVLDLIFNHFSKEYPKALTYLLTHPLLPSTHTNGILARFKTYPRLFKQAIVTCPNIPLNELLQELFTVLNDELSLDLSLRILQDFTEDDIKQNIKKMNKVDLNNFIDFVLNESKDFEEHRKNKPQLFHLLNLIIESIGLFTLQQDQLYRLSNFIDSQVALADRMIELLYLLDGVVTPKKGKSSANATRPEDALNNLDKTVPLYSVEYLEN